MKDSHNLELRVVKKKRGAAKDRSEHIIRLFPHTEGYCPLVGPAVRLLTCRKCMG